MIARLKRRFPTRGQQKDDAHDANKDHRTDSIGERNFKLAAGKSVGGREDGKERIFHRTTL